MLRSSIYCVCMNLLGMYNPEPTEQSSKYKRRFKSLHSIIENILNQSRNEYNQDTIYIENYEELISRIFFT
jgi:hypothetical protein